MFRPSGTNCLQIVSKITLMYCNKHLSLENYLENGPITMKIGPMCPISIAIGPFPTENCVQAGKKLHLLSEKLASLGIMGDQLMVPLNLSIR